MDELLARTIPLALAAAVSPTILILNLLVLSDPRHGKARSAAFVVGAGAVLAGFTVFAYLVIKPASEGRPPDADVFGWVDLVAALLLVVLGVRALVKPPKPPKATDDSSDPGAHVVAWLGIGAGAMLTNFSTLVLYLPAVKDVATSSVDPAERVAVVLLLWTITMTFAWLPLVSVVVFGDRAVRILVDLRGVITRHQRTITAVVTFAFAAYLTVKGIDTLIA